MLNEYIKENYIVFKNEDGIFNTIIIVYFILQRVSENHFISNYLDQFHKIGHNTTDDY